MPVTREELVEKLNSSFNPVHLEVEDVSGGCGAKFQLLIVSESFNGHPLLQQQRMVNSALENEMKEIHALQMKTMTPENWEKKKQLAQ